VGDRTSIGRELMSFEWSPRLPPHSWRDMVQYTRNKLQQNFEKACCFRRQTKLGPCEYWMNFATICACFFFRSLTTIFLKWLKKIKPVIMSEKVGYRYGEFWYYSEHMTEMSRPEKKNRSVRWLRNNKTISTSVTPFNFLTLHATDTAYCTSGQGSKAAATGLTPITGKITRSLSSALNH